MATISFDLTRGINRDVAPLKLPEGFASDGRHVRFADGACRKMTGYSRFHDETFPLPVVGMLSFRSSGGDDYVVLGMKLRLARLFSGSRLYFDPLFTGDDDTRWSIAPFGDWILASNGIEPVQIILPPYGEADIGPLMANPSRARVVKTFQRHVFVLGDVHDPPGEPSGVYPFRVQWSDIDDPYTWIPLDTNEARYIDLYESETPVVGADGMGDIFVVYTRNQIHVFRYVGGNYVFSRRIVEWNVGLLAQNLVATAEGVQYFMSHENFYAFNGSRVTPIGENINREVYAAINDQYIHRGFAFTVKRNSEVWFVVPTGTSEVPNLACVYSYRTGAWTFDDLASYSGSDRLPDLHPLFCSSLNLIQALDESENADDQPVAGYVDTPDFGDETTRFTVTRVTPFVESTAGEVEILVGTREKVNDPVTWSSPYIFTPSTDNKVDVRESGRIIRFRVRTANLNSPFAVQRLEATYYPRGGR